MYACIRPSKLLLWISACIFLTAVSSHSHAKHPVLTWGEIRSIYSDSYSDSTDSTTTNWSNIFTINANTYVWRPWFGILSGSLSIVDSQSESDTLSDSDNNSLGGSLQFKLFPTSRFPFLIYFSESRFEQDNEISESIFTQRTIGMRQQYSSWDNKQNYVANYQRQTRNIPNESTAKSELFTFGANYLMPRHRLAANIGYSENIQPGEEDQNNASLLAKHSFAGSKEYSLENQFAASESSNAFSSATTELRSKQFTSSGAWAPQHNSKLRVSGNFRIDDKQQTFAPQLSNTQAVVISQQTANLNQGLTYLYDDNLTLSQSANISQSQSNNQSQTSASESAGADYSADTIITELGAYSWFASASLSNQHGDAIDSFLSLTSQLGHSLSKEIILSPDVSLSASFAQNISYSTIFDGDSSGSLGNSGSLGWANSKDSDTSTVRASISDSRSLDNDFESQIFNLLANHNIRHDRFTNLSAELNYQRTRSKSKILDSTSSGSESLSAQFSYSSNKFFNTPGLTFRSTLDATKNTDLSPDTFSTNTDEATRYSWENELFYRIGLFESRISLDYIKSREIDNRTIIIEITRTFGDR